MQGTKVQKGNRGITLIALVVTIIVLLILAGVSIQMITGQSGILSQARQAKEETTKGQIRDNVRREILEKMTEKYGEDLTADEIKAILDKYFTDVPASGDAVWNAGDFPTSFPQIHSNDGNYPFNLGELYSGTLSGTQTPPPQGGTPGNPDPETGIFTKNSTIDGETGSYNNPTIPAGFKPVNPDDDPSVGKADWGNGESKPTEEALNAGLVIEDKEHNQFVWIPVPKAISETEVSTNTNSINLDSETTPMAELVDGKYRGVLYQTWNVSAKTVKYIQYSETGRREPDTVTEYDVDINNLQKIKNILEDEENYESEAAFKSIMQKDYNAMVESVSTYGGFYVARYEMSLNGDNAEYKKDKTSTSAADANSWYGFYAYNKQFATANEYSSVESSMIWGSQYDAMMNWMIRSGINIASSNIDGKNRNTGETTGIVVTDVLNNVYDLLGNRYEWTLEANSTRSRTRRGGSFGNDTSPSSRYGDTPTGTFYNYGSRASLYIL